MSSCLCLVDHLRNPTLYLFFLPRERSHINWENKMIETESYIATTFTLASVSSNIGSKLQLVNSIAKICCVCVFGADLRDTPCSSMFIIIMIVKKKNAAAHRLLCWRHLPHIKYRQSPETTLNSRQILSPGSLSYRCYALQIIIVLNTGKWWMMIKQRESNQEKKWKSIYDLI